MQRPLSVMLLIVLGACAGGRQDAVDGTPRASVAVKETLQPVVATPPAPGQQVQLMKRMHGGHMQQRQVVAAERAELVQNRETYQVLNANSVQRVAEQAVSTFSIDVDTGSYSNVRRMLQQGRLPQTDAVRIEEMVNYFPYDYAPPTGDEAFAVQAELAPSPWNPANVLLRIGIKGRDIGRQQLPPANLVFLVDTSGSMMADNKLPLVKSSLKLLVKHLRAQDQISLVTYAGDTHIMLPPTSGSDKAAIVQAIDRLGAGGGTHGASGILLAYQMAEQGFKAGGINRILLATDGDFNVGITDIRALKNLVEEKRKSGVSLSTLGYGGGNYNDHLMEQLADVGNGAYSYIDSLMEGHKVLVTEMTSTLATIASDVKIQIEFNPAAVSEYRLIGYENRVLQREDFNNDQVDAGEIGAGHTVTALYELTLAGQKGLIDPLRYQARSVAAGGELGFVKLRHKAPGSAHSSLRTHVLKQNSMQKLGATSDDFRFASAVAGFGQLLRGGRHTGTWGYADARQLAASAMDRDTFGYRAEFLRMIDLASALGTSPPAN